MNDWILCSEKLPKITEECDLTDCGMVRRTSDFLIVTTNDGDVVLAKYYDDKITDLDLFHEQVGTEDYLRVWIAQDPDGYFEEYVDVVAWMPFPEPYKEEK